MLRRRTTSTLTGINGLKSQVPEEGDGLVVKTKYSLLLRCISSNMPYSLVADNKPRRVCHTLLSSRYINDKYF